MGELLKVCGIALLASFAALILRQIRGDMSVFIRIGGVVIILSLALIPLATLLFELRDMAEGQGAAEYAVLLIKALGIAFISKLAGDICRDLGEGGLASVVELFGKISILSLSIPLISELMGYVSAALGG